MLQSYSFFPERTLQHVSYSCKFVTFPLIIVIGVIVFAASRGKICSLVGAQKKALPRQKKGDESVVIA